MLPTTRRRLLEFFLLLLFGSTTSTAFGFVTIVHPTHRRLPREASTRLFGMFGDLARSIGKSVGQSDWKQVGDAFVEGMEESEINARARNAKPMEQAEEMLLEASSNDEVAVDLNATTTATVEVEEVHVEALVDEEKKK